MIRPPPSSTLFPSTPLSRSPPEEQAVRIRAMQERLRRYDARTWAMRFLERLDEAVRFSEDLEETHRPRPRVVAAEPFLRSEEHTSELQSRSDIVCRLLL